MNNCYFCFFGNWAFSMFLRTNRHACVWWTGESGESGESVPLAKLKVNLLCQTVLQQALTVRRCYLFRTFCPEWRTIRRRDTWPTQTWCYTWCMQHLWTFLNAGVQSEMDPILHGCHPSLGPHSGGLSQTKCIDWYTSLQCHWSHWSHSDFWHGLFWGQGNRIRLPPKTCGCFASQCPRHGLRWSGHRKSEFLRDLKSRMIQYPKQESNNMIPE